MTYEEAFFDELARIEKDAGIGGALIGGGLGSLGGAAAGMLMGGPAGAAMGFLGGGALGTAAGGAIGGRRMARTATTLGGAALGSALGPVGTVAGGYLGSRLFKPKAKPPTMKAPALPQGPSLAQMSGAGLPRLPG